MKRITTLCITVFWLAIYCQPRTTKAPLASDQGAGHTLQAPVVVVVAEVPHGVLMPGIGLGLAGPIICRLRGLGLMILWRAESRVPEPNTPFKD